jgi:hypothetical protein
MGKRIVIAASTIDILTIIVIGLQLKFLVVIISAITLISTINKHTKSTDFPAVLLKFKYYIK